MALPPYDFGLIENSTSLIQPLQAANTFTAGMLGVFLLMFVTLGIYFGLRSANGGEPTKNIMLATTFASMIVGVFLRLLNILDTRILTGVIVICILAFTIIANLEK